MILEESLHRKIELLSAIEMKSKEQSELFQNGEVTLPRLDELMDNKAEYIEQIEKLDEGFDSLYQKIKAELLDQKAAYATEIASIQKLIGRVTELSASIQSIETRNKQMVENHFRKERQEIKKQRASSEVTMNYYKNMNKVNMVSPQFMDEKK